MIKTIPLDKLVPSSRNVRRTSDEHADLQLKADIEARGLLQNLVVSALSKPRGRFAVEAGGRRLRALHSLAEEGKLSKGHEVSCFVIDGDPASAQEASLAENFQRLAMNPADECVAFGQLVEQGADIEGIARRFGLTARFVEGRLRLATLAPVVFEALGAGAIGLDAAKAYAATSDQERQAFVFEQMSRGYGYAHPDSIRRMMTQATASASDPRARFVGEEDYLAAGGRVERDLFCDEAATRWLDVALLERLAAEKLELLAADAASESGLGWVRPVLDSWIGYTHTEGLQRLELECPPLSEAESAEVDALEAELEHLSAALEDEQADAETQSAAETRIRELGDRIDAIVSKPPVLDDALRQRAGAFLLLDQRGRPTLDRRRFVVADEADPQLAGETSESAAETANAGPRTPSLSRRLVDELAMQRRDILAAHIACDGELALDLAIFLMIDRGSGYSLEKSGFTLRAATRSDPVGDLQTSKALATMTLTEAAEALDRGWTGGDTRAERFDAFRALGAEAKAAWLGHAVAGTLEASVNLAGERTCAFHDHLGRLLGIDVAGWWRPTGANFFDRVPKSITLAALTEIGGAGFSGRYASAKKAELAQTCERIFSGDFVAEPELKATALAWIPEAMRFATGSADSSTSTPDGQDVEATAAAEGGANPARLNEAVEEAA